MNIEQITSKLNKSSSTKGAINIIIAKLNAKLIVRQEIMAIAFSVYKAHGINGVAAYLAEQYDDLGAA